MPIFLADFTKQNNMTENEMTGLLLELADLGITGIRIYYEGGGDSGSIESMTYTTGRAADYTDKEMFEVIEDLEGWNAETDLTILNTTLSRKLEEFAHAKILDDIEDWWNNDGGYGTLCILVPSGKYLIKNNVRYSEFHEYIHESDLIKESIE
jgi:hypothetical protein